MLYQNQKLQKLSRDTKFELISARREAGLTQAEVSVHLGISTKIYEAWENTDNERQPHACIIPVLPPVMAERWMEFFCREMSGHFTRALVLEGLNGDTREEEEQIIVALGRAIDIVRKDPSQKKRASKFYDHIIEAARKAKAELQRM